VLIVIHPFRFVFGTIKRENLGPDSQSTLGSYGFVTFQKLLGKFRTSTKTITITNTSSFCGYERQSRDVIFGRFAGVNEDRLPFSYGSTEHNFVHFLRFMDMFPVKMQYNLII
jgi:hypothetical protein